LPGPKKAACSFLKGADIFIVSKEKRESICKKSVEEKPLEYGECDVGPKACIENGLG